MRVAVRVARGPGAGPQPASDAGAEPEGASATPVRPVRDWSAWAVRSVAEVGMVERRRARAAAGSLLTSATSLVANDPNLGRLVREIAAAQLEPLIDQALPLVLDRLAEDPATVRRIVQDQSAGILTEAADTARHSARHGDEAVDTLVNRLLHRGPHAQAAKQADRVP